MTEHGICAKCKKSVGCPYADDRITGCKNFVLEHELKLTSKEWLRQANTEQLAEFLVMIQMSVMHPVKRGAVDMDKFIEDVAEWLKQPHQMTTK